MSGLRRDARAHAGANFEPVARQDVLSFFLFSFLVLWKHF